VTLLTVVVMSACSNPNDDLPSYYESQDTLKYVSLVESKPTMVRRRLTSAILRSILEARISGDSVAYHSATKTADWLVSVYENVTSLRDVSRMKELYESWSQDESIRKRELDSTYDWIRTTLQSDPLSVKYLQSMSALREEYQGIRDSFYLASIDYSISEKFQTLQKSDSCEWYARRSIKVANAVGYYGLVGDCYSFLLARLHSASNANYEEAVLDYRMALASYKRARREDRFGHVYNGQGYNRYQLGKREEAIESFRLAAESFRKHGLLKDAGYGLELIAETYSDLNEMDSARIYAQQSYSLRLSQLQETASSASDLAYSLSAVGRIATVTSEFDSAESRFAQADSLFRIAKDNEGIVLNLVRTGQLHLELKRIALAREDFTQVLRDSKQPEAVIEGLFGLAQCDYANGLYQSAIENLKKSVFLIEQNRNKLTLEENLSGVLTEKIEIYNLLAISYLRIFSKSNQREYLDSAISVLELSKARTLNEKLLHKSATISPAVDSILSSISKLFTEQILGRVDQTSFTADMRAFEDSLRAIRIQSNRLESVTHEPSAVGENPKRSDHQKLREITEANEIVIEYVLSKFGCFAIVYDEEISHILELSDSMDTIDKKITDYVRLIKTPPDTKVREFTDAGKSLFQVLFPAKLRAIVEDRDLIVVPVERLHILPFAALIDDAGRYLVESRDIRYAPSVKSLISLSERGAATHANDSILLVGDIEYGAHSGVAKLRYSGQELGAIATSFNPEKTVILRGAGTTESAFKELDFTHFRIVHLSTHGIANQYRPSRSNLVLASSADHSDDARLRTYEIAMLNIPAELVFLSSCETASGRLMPGEGVMSLARSFLIAGSQSVVATLWQVDDRFTVGFVESFYQHSGNATPTVRALSVAQRTMLESARKQYRHPYYWSPFMFIGK
jgi:tetratricopeptide (TPR) repeat protein